MGWFYWSIGLRNESVLTVLSPIVATANSQSHTRFESNVTALADLIPVLVVYRIELYQIKILIPLRNICYTGSINAVWPFVPYF